MSKLSERMVDCLRSLEAGPRLVADMLSLHTGWSVKALLRRGYVMPYDNMIAITPTGLLALGLETHEPQTVGPRAAGASASLAFGGVGQAAVQRAGDSPPPGGQAPTGGA